MNPLRISDLGIGFGTCLFLVACASTIPRGPDHENRAPWDETEHPPGTTQGLPKRFFQGDSTQTLHTLEGLSDGSYVLLWGDDPAPFQVAQNWGQVWGPDSGSVAIVPQEFQDLGPDSVLVKCSWWEPGEQVVVQISRDLPCQGSGIVWIDWTVEVPESRQLWVDTNSDLIPYLEFYVVVRNTAGGAYKEVRR